MWRILMEFVVYLVLTILALLFILGFVVEVVVSNKQQKRVNDAEINSMRTWHKHNDIKRGE